MADDRGYTESAARPSLDEMAKRTYDLEKKRVESKDSSKDDIIDGIYRSAKRNVEEKFNKKKTQELIDSIPKIKD